MSGEPYVGPRPFAREDAERFFGRESEAADLASLVLAHRALLLYAPSGAGKSSLLAARVLPLLRAPERGALVLGPARVSGELPEELAEAEVANLYAFHALTSLGVASEEARRGDLAAGVERLAREHALASDRPAVLVLDQFEELFTRHPERWRERAPFFQALGAASDRLAALRIVLSMREEHIAELVPFARLLPENLRGRFRLERLRRNAALAAIVGPLTGFARRFAPGAAERLVDNLLRVPVQVGGEMREVEGEYVEPVHLQVVCQRLWRSLASDDAEIDVRAIDTRGGVDEALEGYYDDCVAEIARETSEGEARLRRWVDRTLITSEGTRALVHKGAVETAGLATPVVERLESRHLLRAELRGGGIFFELAHDRFLGPVRRSNRKFRERQMTQHPELAAAEGRALLWVKAGRPAPTIPVGRYLVSSRDVLRESDALNSIHRLLERAPAGELAPSDALREYLEVHRERYRSVAVRFFGAAILVLFLIACGLVGGIIYTLDLRKEAENARAEVQHGLEIERGRLALEFTNARGRELDALELALRAVAPALAEERDPPDEAVDGLTAAVSRVFTRAPLVTPSAATRDAAINASGTMALAWGPRSLCGFDARWGALLFELDAPEGFEWSFAVPDRRGEVAIAGLLKREEPNPKAVYQQTAELPNRSVSVSVFQMLDLRETPPKVVSSIEDEVEESEGGTSLDFMSLVHWDADNTRAYFSKPAQLRILAPDQPSLELSLEDVEGNFYFDVAAAPNGERAVVVLNDSLVLFDPRNATAVAGLPDRLDKAWGFPSCAFSADSQRLILLVEPDETRVESVIRSASDGRELSRRPVRLGQLDLEWLGFVGDGDELLLVGHESSDASFGAVWFDAGTGAVRHSETVPGFLIGQPQRSALPPRFLVSSELGRGTVSIWDPATRASTSAATWIDTYQRILADAACKTLVILSDTDPPELRWPLRDALLPSDLRELVAVACERLRGRPEFAELLAEVEAAR